MWWKRKATEEMTNLSLLTVEHWTEIKHEKPLLLQKNVLQEELLCCLKHLKDKDRTIEHNSVAKTKVKEQGQPSEIRRSYGSQTKKKKKEHQ